MPRKCPADYNDSMQSDSDCNNDSEYIQVEKNEQSTPVSPQLSGGVSHAYRLRQLEKKNQGRQNSFDAANNALIAKRNRITPPTREEDDDEITMPPKRQKNKKYNRHRPSVVWDHVTKSANEDKVQCNHCVKLWNSLSGSTSTPLTL